MAFKLGMDCKLYRNTATYASPTWDLIGNVKDVTLSVEAGEADVTTRGNAGWKATVATLREATIEFEMVWDTTDADFTDIQTKFLTAATIEFLCLDGVSTAASGSQGLRATCAILKFSRKETLAEAVMVSVTVKPAYATNAPAWYTA